MPIIIWRVSIEKKWQKERPISEPCITGCSAFSRNVSFMFRGGSTHNTLDFCIEKLVEMVFCSVFSKQNDEIERFVHKTHKIKKCRAWLLSCVSIAFDFILHSIDKQKHLDFKMIFDESVIMHLRFFSCRFVLFSWNYFGVVRSDRNAF